MSARIKASKKTKSTIKGDIFPQLIGAYPDLLAIPLTKIYNLIMYTYHWPDQWKLETVTVIPKGRDASSYGECRNLSCTPLFSKICESFLMDRILKEVKVDNSQYGGIKKCGPEHLLLQSWDNILTGLEDNRGSINIMSLDYSKAFNRMSHQACVRAFAKKGASSQTLNLIAAFLSGRRMTVRIGSSFSKERPINGGSLQGCVTANALFCATVEFLQEGHLEENDVTNEVAFAPSFGQDRSLFAGATILGDVVSLEDNGVDCGPVYDVDEAESTISWGPIGPPESFAPRTHSSPKINGHINYSSHVTSKSSLQFTISDSPEIVNCRDDLLVT